MLIKLIGVLPFCIFAIFKVLISNTYDPLILQLFSSISFWSFIFWLEFLSYFWKWHGVS